MPNNSETRKKSSKAAQKRREREKLRKAFMSGLTTGVAITAVAAIALTVLFNGGERGGSDPVKQENVSVVLPTSTVLVSTPAPTPTMVPATVTAVPMGNPAAAVTQAPTAAPTQETLPAGEYQQLSGVPQTDRILGLPQTAQVPDAYFNDAVFIGDSVTLKLNYFVRQARQNYASLLGDAKFLTAGSMGSGNAMESVSDSSIHPSYQGKKMLLEDAVAAMGAKKVFIMLGMNDIAVYGPEQAAQNMMTLIGRIRAKSPNAQIFIQSATPRLKGNYKKLNNNALFEYDLALFELCKGRESEGIYFVDVAYIMRDAEGNLPANYCSDPEDQALHFTDEACGKWIEYLYTHALV